MEAHRNLAQLYKKWHIKEERQERTREEPLNFSKHFERHTKQLPPQEAEPLVRYIEGKGMVSLFWKEEKVFL